MVLTMTDHRLLLAILLLAGACAAPIRHAPDPAITPAVIVRTAFVPLPHSGPGPRLACIVARSSTPGGAMIGVDDAQSFADNCLVATIVEDESLLATWQEMLP